ncbi:MAG: MmcQ/YjbR family DNA-binding protein [Polyangiaceae bacterium]
MPVSAKRAKELALSLESASSAPHFDRLALRTPRRIFATLARSGVDINFMFDHAQQKHFCDLAPHVMSPVPGGWGRMGATRCDLAQVDTKTFTAALKAAHERANAPRPKAIRKTKR